MILIDNFEQVISQIEKERGISKEVLIEAIKASLLAACRRKFDNIDNLEVTIDEVTGDSLIFASKEVVETVEDDLTQISLNEAKEYQDDVEIGDVIMIEVTPDNFGRIAIQTAKQVIMQKIREAEKQSIGDEFEAKVNTIVTATVQRREGKNYLLNLGRTEALLYPKDQIYGERFNQKDLVKVFVVSVDETPKGPKVVVSRTHPGLLKALFELEIPEINEGVIEVMGVAREPGSRAKVAVKSNDPEVGAVGTCVGHMGGRIQNIVKSLNNERIDIIEWSKDPYELLVAALKPAKINKIRLEESAEKNEEGKTEKKAFVYVDEDQLSLAIGKGGQNVRLASKLTGWNIEVAAEQSSFTDNLKSAIKAAKEQEENENKENISEAPAEDKATPEASEESNEASEDK
jgi:N utilization substance protein A